MHTYSSDGTLVAEASRAASPALPTARCGAQDAAPPRPFRARAGLGLRRISGGLASAACQLGLLGLVLGCSESAVEGSDSAGDTSSDVSGDVSGGQDGADAAPSDGRATAGGTPSPAFAAGCPVAGKSLIRQLQADGERFEGPASLAAKGDWMLANTHAAFVIKSPTETEHTYAYYGGLLVDAVALDGCSQAAPEQYGEMPLLIGRIDVGNFPATVLRTFRGTSAEVIADGSDGGPAVLRVHGVDDWFWLVELELIKQAYIADKPKQRSLPLGIKLALDYTLAPDRAALQIDLVAINDTAKPQELHVGAAAFLDDSTPQQVWSAGTLAIGGFGLKTNLPWITGSAATGAVVIAVDAQNLATAHISGVDALIPVDQLGEPLRLAPKGSPGDTDLQRFWVGVGRADSASAIATLEGVAVGGKAWTGVDVAGVVREEGSGEAIGGARVNLERKRNDGSFATLASARADDKGNYALRVPRVGAAGHLRLVAHAAGRDSSPAAVMPEGDGPFTDVELRLGPVGALGHDVRDGDGKPIPARLTLYGKGGVHTGLYFATGGQATVPVPPGEYTLVITRGYHHRPWSGEVQVAPHKTTAVTATLPRVVDTSGWMSFDGHVHSHPSPDSTVPLVERYRTAAAEGVDVVVHTEHEIVVDSEPARLASGVAAFVRGVGGEEVTATLPEHTNAFGLQPDPSHRRGAPVKWMGLDLGQIYAAERARGAAFVSLNHPRKGCNWLCVIGWDRLLVAPTLTDPTVVGLPAGATLWSWDFESVELLNGMDKALFHDQKAPDSTGTFEDWMSFWNGGHRITGLGVTDTHGYGPPGAPRTYFRVPKDDLTAFSLPWMTEAVKAGRTQVSAGGFARVSADGGKSGPGDLVPKSAIALDKDGKATLALQVRVEAIPEIDVTRVLVLVNCDTALDVQATAPGDVVKLDKTLQVPIPAAVLLSGLDAHVTVLAFGKQPMPKGLESADAHKVPRVITNPMVLDLNGDGAFQGPGGKACAVTPGG